MLRTAHRLARTALTLLAATLAPFATAQTTLRIIETTDVHGNYLPHDFINGTAGVGSLARIHSYVEQQRGQYGAEHVLLLDAGDILQGQPSAYFYNFIDTTATHLCADALNFMHYDALALGNHDVEAGHGVYDRWARQCLAPVLAANVLDSRSKQPYFPPYVIIEKRGKGEERGIRIGVLGLLTPTIPQWLPQQLWSGLQFDDMVATAQRYMPELRQQADIVVGLFHSGVGQVPANRDHYALLAENAALAVGRLVPGFDLILCGHDHRRADTLVVNVEGDTVRVINAGPNAEFVATATVTIPAAGGRPHVATAVEDIRPLEPSTAFLTHFTSQQQAVEQFTQEVIGHNSHALSSRTAYFGPCVFVGLINDLQLQIAQADISFCAPLSFDAEIPKGDIRVGDMFNLYRYENQLYAMRLSGLEIKDYLEYSYAGWLADSVSAQSMLNFVSPAPSNVGSGEGWKLLAVPSYNFDSAAGLRYTVDVSRPAGQRVSIQGLSDGRPFDLAATYRVAVNSYRGNGGGGHLTRGAGIPKDSLQGRIEWSTDKDLRYYLMQHIRRQGHVRARQPRNWKFTPRRTVKAAARHDAAVLFR